LSKIKIKEEEINGSITRNPENVHFKITIEGTSLKKYKQIKRLLDLLRMQWFE